MKAKNGTKRVAVRALNFSTRPFCMTFQSGSNRDGPEGQNPQKWAKNKKKKMLHQKFGLPEIGVRSENQKSCRLGSRYTNPQHKLAQPAQNCHANLDVNVRIGGTFTNGPKMDADFFWKKSKNRVDVEKRNVLFGGLPGDSRTIKHCKLCKIFIRIQP